VVHLAAIYGVVISKDVMVLGIGVFIVWPPKPTVIVGNYVAKEFPRKDFWKAALAGCPSWIKKLTVGIGIYAGLNFFYFVYANRIPENRVPVDVPGTSSLLDLRMFTGHFMVFYFTAFATLPEFPRKLLWRRKQRVAHLGIHVEPFSSL